MEMPVSILHGIVNNAQVTLQPTHQSDGALNHSHPHFCLVDSLLSYAPDSVVNRIEVRGVWRPQIWKFVGVTGTIIS